MKKIDISEEDFNEVLNEVITTFEASKGAHNDSIRDALQQHIFNVQKSFDKNKWNSCVVTPPKEYRKSYFVVRPKNSSGFIDCSLCFFSEFSNTFINTNGNYPFSNKDASKFEYKLFEV